MPMAPAPARFVLKRVARPAGLGAARTGSRAASWAVRKLGRVVVLGSGREEEEDEDEDEERKWSSRVERARRNWGSLVEEAWLRDGEPAGQSSFVAVAVTRPQEEAKKRTHRTSPHNPSTNLPTSPSPSLPSFPFPPCLPAPPPPSPSTAPSTPSIPLLLSHKSITPSKHSNATRRSACQASRAERAEWSASWRAEGEVVGDRRVAARGKEGDERREGSARRAERVASGRGVEREGDEGNGRVSAASGLLVKCVM